MKKVRLLMLSPVDGLQECICGDLDDYYREIGCDTIDIVVRRIGGELYDIICDDEGLLKEDPKVSAISADCRPMLVGNLIFAKHNNQGETTSLSNDDVIRILSQITHGIDPRDGSVKMAVKVRY